MNRGSKVYEVPTSDRIGLLEPRVIRVRYRLTDPYGASDAAAYIWYQKP